MPGNPEGLCLTQPQLLLILQPEVIETSLPGPGTLGWVAWYGTETPCSLGGRLRIQDILPDYYLPHMGVGPAHSTSLPLLPASL